jgi:hypothetical protein
MDKLEIGVALIRKIDTKIQWLGILNDSKSQVDFVTAQRLENESWRETIMREVAWQLEIDRKRDIVVSNMAQLNLEFETVLPGTSEPTQLSCAFYNVQLYGKETSERIDGREPFVWLTSDEICNGVTKTGIPISPLVVQLNQKANVIQRWESDSIEGDWL